MTKKRKILILFMVVLAFVILYFVFFRRKSTGKASTEIAKEIPPENMTYDQQLAFVQLRINEQPEWQKWIRERAQAENKTIEIKTLEEIKHNLTHVGITRIKNEQWPYIPFS